MYGDTIISLNASLFATYALNLHLLSQLFQSFHNGLWRPSFCGTIWITRPGKYNSGILNDDLFSEDGTASINSVKGSLNGLESEVEQLKGLLKWFDDSVETISSSHLKSVSMSCKTEDPASRFANPAEIAVALMHEIVTTRRSCRQIQLTRHNMI